MVENLSLDVMQLLGTQYMPRYFFLDSGMLITLKL